ncbi:putative zinc-binding protein [Methanoplanus limicola]|uniref:DGC domain protein n=1 Tax=Methanoplanus limicola DSM 2279 TaxID=937775 RepID=H1Z220_9EURY|nr:putative zinc-binding protein [Methanoplanus limicola]EHQ36365.1 DGC domain protein [Methanoplanus limicola DSM 2279]
MTDIPQCTCSCGDAAGGKKKIIFACSGASNVGELSNAAAVTLTKEGFGNKACTASLAIKTPSVMKKTEDADEIVVIDGCQVGCAGQIAENAGVDVDQYIIITKLGIKKTGDMDIVEDDLESVVSAAWEGKCICRENEDNKSDNSRCGCGGGCR